ncbi:MAG: hypothetical protein JO122_16445 [Acetobacteraceae bacterium]|nr:hypothetical protein [Acetobacteraceae bacterium]
MTFYWDLNDRTRAFTNRIRPRRPSYVPGSEAAGNHPSTLQRRGWRCGVARKKATTTASHWPWDVRKLVATTPAQQAFAPISEGGCRLVTS